MLRQKVLLAPVAMLLLALVAGCGGHSGDSDPIVGSFAYMADNQIGQKPWLATKAQNPSSANLPQLGQSFTDLANLKPAPAFVAMGGDTVLNEAMDDGQTLQGQLDAWQTFKASRLDANSLDLLMINGNHETDVYNPSLNLQYPNPPCFDIWLNWLAANSYDTRSGNGPTPGSSESDMLVRDESRLSYSFDSGSSHFTVINTGTLSTVIDPASGKPINGWIPINWIEADVKNAQANSSIKTIFVLGHKPIEFPAFAIGDTDGIINTTDYPFATRLATLLRENTKVRAYICSHVHAYSAFRLENGKGVWQFIVGNAGVKPDPGWAASDQDFGFAIFQIHQSGKVTAVRFGRKLPPPPQLFYEGSPIHPKPAVVKSTIVINSR